MPKYSIILPVYNAEKFIRDSISSVLNNNYNDFEFIISNNCSTDGTESILNEICDNRVKVIKPDETLPLGAHWNFAIKHATGEWLWAMGADDAMVPYFFDVCDRLVEICKNKSLNVIKSNRANYFWPGCEKNHGNTHISFSVYSNFEIKKTSTIMNSMLDGKASYFDLPQMYVSSLFNRALIDKAISFSKTKEIIPYNVPSQDSYLGILACMFEERYLYVNIPLGWVGTSLSAMFYKAKKQQLFYTDCSYNILVNKVPSLLFNMHLSFRAFYDNSNFCTKKFRRITSYPEILSKIFYFDLINLSRENERIQAFFSYLDTLNIDKEQIIKRALAMRKKRSLCDLLKKIFGYRLICFFGKMFVNIYKLIIKKNSACWSLVIDNKTFFTYEQINSLLMSEEHIKNILGFA